MVRLFQVRDDRESGTLAPRGDMYGMYVRTTPHPTEAAPSRTTAVRKQVWNMEHHRPTAGIIHTSGGSIILDRRPGAASLAHQPNRHPLSRQPQGRLDRVHWAGWDDLHLSVQGEADIALSRHNFV